MRLTTKQLPLLFALVGSALVVLWLIELGMPVLWGAPLYQLFAGNLLLGLAEGVACASLFKVPKRRAIRFLIAANYVSAIVTFSMLPFFRVWIEDTLANRPLIHAMPAYLATRQLGFLAQGHSPLVLLRRSETPSGAAE